MWACVGIVLVVGAAVGASVAILGSNAGRRAVLEIIPPGRKSLILLEPTSGRVVRRFLTEALLDVEPSWSPDGKWVAYVRLDAYGNSSGIYISNGRTVRRLVSGNYLPLQPEWSPNGKEIVFVSLAGGSTNLWGATRTVWVVNADGTNPRRVSANAAFDHRNPRWSPDGKQLAFAVGTNGPPAHYGGSPRWGVAVTSPRGGKACLVYVTSWSGTGVGGVEWQPGSAPGPRLPGQCLSMRAPSE
jgi:Tol biopolymer transport system component